MARARVNTVERSADVRWRLARLEKHVIGTEDANWQDGLVVWRKELDRKFATVNRLIHTWGAAIVAAVLASGIIDQRAAAVAGAFLHGILGK